MIKKNSLYYRSRITPHLREDECADNERKAFAYLAARLASCHAVLQPFSYSKTNSSANQCPSESWACAMPNLGACGQCCIRSLKMPSRTCGRRGGADTDLVATEQAFLLPIWSACCALTKSEVIYVCQLLFDQLKGYILIGMTSF